MDELKPACERCGAPLTGDSLIAEAPGPGGPLLCAQCASLDLEPESSQARGLNRAAVLISVGLVVLVISVLADVLKFGDAERFGWQQIAGVAVAAMLLLIGAIMRIPTLSVVGVIAGGLAVLADRLGFGNAVGFGSHQIAGTVLGVVVIGAGLVVARMSRADRRGVAPRWGARNR